MTWRDQYQQGSFRGVPFLTERDDKTGGRRNVIHTYPKRDDHFAEDMGRRPREFSITAFVIGDDYMQQRDRLEKALEQEGPGTLVHPYYGTMTVSVNGQYRTGQSTQQGGMATFTISFIQSGRNRFPEASTARADVVKAKSDDALITIKEVFKSQFTVDDLPGAVADHAGGLLAGIGQQLSSISSQFPTVPDVAVDYLADINNVSANTAALVRKPGDLVDSVVAIMQRAGGLFQTTANAIKAYRRFFKYGTTLPNLPAGGVVLTQQKQNQEQLAKLVEQTALIESARTASDIEFVSFNEADALRSELDLELDEQMLVADYEMFRALDDVRVAMIQDITARGADLARLSRFTPGATLPAVVIAHQLYQDATRADEIAQRNGVTHPGFVQGGKELEVLIHS